LTTSNSKPKKEKKKTEINTEPHVQDALLALRLKEFLRAQGVCEEDLRVDFDEEGKMVEAEKGKAVEEAKKEIATPAQQEEDDESNILDEYFMGIEEEEHSGPAKKDRGLVVEDDDVIAQPKPVAPFVEEDDLDMDMDDPSSSSSPVSSALSPPTTPTPTTPAPLTLQVSTMAQQILTSPGLTFIPPSCRPPYLIHGSTPYHAHPPSDQETWFVLV
jgi:hypothetical protein